MENNINFKFWKVNSWRIATILTVFVGLLLYFSPGYLIGGILFIAFWLTFIAWIAITIDLILPKETGVIRNLIRACLITFIILAIIFVITTFHNYGP